MGEYLIQMQSMVKFKSTFLGLDFVNAIPMKDAAKISFCGDFLNIGHDLMLQCYLLRFEESSESISVSTNWKF